MNFLALSENYFSKDMLKLASNPNLNFICDNCNRKGLMGHRIGLDFFFLELGLD
jgi:hypothetical protein